jgi:hypothetical protein
VVSGHQSPLTAEECEGIVLAVKSAFTKLRNLYQRIAPIIEGYGFTSPSAGVLARDLSERIEASIVQHCPSFSKGQKHCDLTRAGCEWEVKGENYIVVNYTAAIQVTKIWVLWNASDAHFSPRKANTNARAALAALAQANIQTLFSVAASAQQSALPSKAAKPAKASISPKPKKHTA